MLRGMRVRPAGRIQDRPIGRCIEACTPDRATVQLAAIEVRQRGDISWVECRLLTFDMAFTHRFDPLRVYVIHDPNT
jgi:hypothetical protein